MPAGAGGAGSARPAADRGVRARARGGHRDRRGGAGRRDRGGMAAGLDYAGQRRRDQLRRRRSVGRLDGRDPATLAGGLDRLVAGCRTGRGVRGRFHRHRARGALLLGMGLSLRLRSAVRWTPTRIVLLAVGVAFGYVTLTGASPLAAPAGGLAGLLTALAAQRINHRRRRQRARAERIGPCRRATANAESAAGRDVPPIRWVSTPEQPAGRA